jgi:AhpC/TSA antioxidant enzyme
VRANPAQPSFLGTPGSSPVTCILRLRAPLASLRCSSVPPAGQPGEQDGQTTAELGIVIDLRRTSGGAGHVREFVWRERCDDGRPVPGKWPKVGESVLRRYDEIVARGIREVVVFHSPAGELRDQVAHLPFPVVADPGQKLYAEFGVGSAPRALLTPAVWPPILSAVLRSSASSLRGRELPPGFAPAGGRLGLPADFLVTVDGYVAAAKYGEHAYDQWSVDDLLRYADHLLQAPPPNPNTVPL